MQDFKWYAVVNHNDPLEQGDFLNNFPIPIPHFDPESINLEENAETSGEILIMDVIIMTQSCDLLKLPPTGQVMLCAREDIRTARINNRPLNTNDNWKKLKRGLIVGATLLNESKRSGYKFGYQVVSLDQVYTVPISYVNSFITSKQEKRIRLLPPYREHLAQAFASQFMRVGLPIPLPDDNPYTP